jgi:hypothetical protein
MFLLIFVFFCLVFTGGFFLGTWHEKDRIFDLNDRAFLVHSWKNKKYKVTEWDDSIFDKNRR